MANYEVKELLTVVKSYARSNPLALDSTSVWDTKAEAENYAKQANAYGGHIITATKQRLKQSLKQLRIM